MRLIDADALKEKCPSNLGAPLWLIDEMPTIEPKHGRWIKRGDNSWECSVCHEISCCNGNYCVDCGARMDGGEK